MDDPLPLLRVRPSQLAEGALVVGDPARAEEAAALLDGVTCLAANREYVTYAGTLDGVAVTVCSHGVGSSGSRICFEELARGGVRRIIRAGTCGALQPDIDDGDLVVATAAIRDEGTTPRLLPLAFPAVADADVLHALEQEASRRGARARRGVVHTTDTFYPSPVTRSDLAAWQAGGALAVEMELSALLITAALHGLAAGGIFTVDGNVTRHAPDMSDYDPYRDVVTRGKAAMLDIALHALVALAPGDGG